MIGRERIHVTRHLFCLTRNFTNDRSLVKLCCKTSFYKTDKTSSYKTKYTHHFVRALVKLPTLGTFETTKHPRLSPWACKYLGWVILTNALTSVYYLYTNILPLFLVEMDIPFQSKNL